jgi:hypothetical protein
MQAKIRFIGESKKLKIAIAHFSLHGGKMFKIGKNRLINNAN